MAGTVSVTGRSTTVDVRSPESGPAHPSIARSSNARARETSSSRPMSAACTRTWPFEPSASLASAGGRLISRATRAMKLRPGASVLVERERDRAVAAEGFELLAEPAGDRALSAERECRVDRIGDLPVQPELFVSGLPLPRRLTRRPVAKHDRARFLLAEVGLQDDPGLASREAAELDAARVDARVDPVGVGRLEGRRARRRARGRRRARSEAAA